MKHTIYNDGSRVGNTVIYCRWQPETRRKHQLTGSCWHIIYRVLTPSQVMMNILWLSLAISGYVLAFVFFETSQVGFLAGFLKH